MKVWMFIKPPGMRAQDRGAKLIIDGGSAAKPYLGYSSSDLVENKKLFSQFASFNTPGSPNWSKLFINIPDAKRAKKYFIEFISASRKRDRHDSSYYRQNVATFDIDSSNIDQRIYSYLQNLEKKLRAKEDVRKRDLQEKNKQQVDELDESLEEIEDISRQENDLLSEEETNSTNSFEDILEESEKVSLILHNPPRTTRANVITISGKVENFSSIDSSEIIFKVNGLEQPVYLDKDGSFSNKIVLFNGDNTIDVEYSSAAGEEHKQITVTSTTPPVKARFTLTWDRGGSEMDLHVKGANGDHCSYTNRVTTNMQLDVDNTSGYGPENISVKLNRYPGKYKVYINHFGGQAANVTLYVYLDNQLVATEKSFLSSGRWHAYDLEID
jgi:hypothetical protein